MAEHPGSVEFARRIRAEVQHRRLESEGRKTVVFRKVRTVFREAGGWHRRGSVNVGLIVDALNVEKVYWRGDLEDRGVRIVSAWRPDYTRRVAIIEPVFVQMKVRQHAGHLRLRRVTGAQGEWMLHVICHNIRKLTNAANMTPLAAT